MALFGMPKRKGLFGNPYVEPPINPDPRSQPMGTPGMGLPQVEQPKMGLGSRLFGRGWENKAFALGGLLQGDQTGVLMMRQEEQAKRDAAAAAQAAELKRAQDLADWEYKQRWNRANPEPTAPDAFDRALMGAGIDPKSPEGQALYKERAASLAGGQDEFVVVPIPGVGTYAGPKSGLEAAFSGAPSAAPQGGLPEGYKVRGGPAGNGGGNFPQ